MKKAKAEEAAANPARGVKPKKKLKRISLLSKESEGNTVMQKVTEGNTVSEKAVPNNITLEKVDHS